MKRITFMIAVMLSVLTATAQTLIITTGQVTWQFPAAQAGDMLWSDGTTLTVMDKVFNVSDITSLTVDNSEVTASSVGVTARWKMALRYRTERLNR